MFEKIRARGVGGMAEPLKSAAPLSVPRRVKAMCFNKAVNTCCNYLRGGQPSHRLQYSLALLEPCWGYFSLLGASWGNFLHLLRLMSLLVGFLASWAAPELILEGPGRARGGFWSLKTSICQCFCACTHLARAHAPTLTKHWQGR